MSEFDARSEALRRGGAMIAAAIFMGSLAIAWGTGRTNPRYQIAAVGGTIVRLESQSGDMLACDTRQCVRIDDGVTEQRIGPVGVVINKRTSRSALPAPEAPAAPLAPTAPKS